MITPDMTIREVFAMMRKTSIGFMKLDLTDKNNKPIAGLAFFDGPKEAALGLAAVAEAQEQYERDNAPKGRTNMRRAKP